MCKYILLTSAKNEEAYIEKTILSVCAQTIKPSIWIIIDDHSTDNTKLIIDNYSIKYPFIKYRLSSSPISERSFQSKVCNLNYGVSCVSEMDYSFIGTLDTDIELPSNYFERIITIMHENERLGIAGGWITEENNGVFLPRIGNRSDYVPGAIQFYRGVCFRQIGNFIPLHYGGYDTLMCYAARMNCWTARSFEHLHVKHLRKTSSSISKGITKSGKRDYGLRYPFHYALIKSLSRMFYRPFVFGSIYYLSGYLSSYLKKEQLDVLPEELDIYLRQNHRLITLLHRKLSHNDTTSVKMG